MIDFSRFLSLQFSAGGGPITRIFSQRLGACIAWGSALAGLKPNHLTLFSMATSVSASLLYAALAPGWPSLLICLLLYELAYGFDCADGQLARATGRTSEFGAWLDVAVDTVSVLALSFAVLYWLAGEHQLWVAGFLGVALMTIGRVLSLHTSQAVGASEHARQHRPFNLSELPKMTLWFVFDTPVFLLMICLLRDLPFALMSYAFGMGIVYMSKVGYLGLRLQRT